MEAQGRVNSYEQKKKFHAMIRDISRQVPWDDEMLDEKEWKFRILGAFYGQEHVPNVFYDASDPTSKAYILSNRRRTRDLDKSDDTEDLSMSSLITQLLAFGNEKGVQWTDPAWQSYIAECEGRN